jgi:hypothetical protein
MKLQGHELPRIRLPLRSAFARNHFRGGGIVSRDSRDRGLLRGALAGEVLRGRESPMMRGFRLVAAGLLACMAVALVVGILQAHGWGGNMEVKLLVFGDPVWVTVDMGSPRLWFLLVIPGVLLAGACSLYARRSGE